MLDWPRAVQYRSDRRIWKRSESRYEICAACRLFQQLTEKSYE